MHADDVIRELQLEPHPEGGWYAPAWRHAGEDAAGRPLASSIYFLLRRGERSAWHRVDVEEMWHHYAGDPLQLEISLDGERVEEPVLGVDVAAGQRPQHVVPAHAWQAAESLGAWTLAGCTLTPGFRWEGFELAPPGWSPRQPS